MSLTLLAPWALLAAALLAVPVVIHLLKPRRVKRTPFSSLRWLHLSPQKLSRRIQWHQVLLFLLRAGFVVLLVLALARPLISSGDASKFRDRYIVIDVSHSMSSRTERQATPMERARELAEELVLRHQPGDRTAVLLVGTQPRFLMPLTRTPKNYLPALRALQASQSETDLGAALPLLRGLMSRSRDDAEAEIYLITDNQQHAWRQGAGASVFEDLAAPAKVMVVDVGVSTPENAWITRARLLEFAQPARRVLRVEMACVGNVTQERTLHVGAVEDMPARSQTVYLSQGRPVVLDLPVPAAAKLTTGLLRFRLTPDDALPADDEYLLNLHAQGAIRVLLVEGPGTASDPLASGFHLKTALEALTEEIGQPLKIMPLAALEAKPADFRDADVIILADAPDLSDEALAALEERVRGGAGLAVVLGSSGKPAFLNDRLHKQQHPSEGLLPSPLRAAEAGEGRLAPLTDVLWTHPLLTGLNDPLVGDLGLTHFQQWYNFTGPLDERDVVLARIDGGAPAFMERPFGTGRVVILNTGAGDRWSDLVKRKSFVAFFDRILLHLASAGPRGNYVVGETIVVPLRNLETFKPARVTGPDDKEVKSAVRKSGDGRGLLSFEATQAGVYTVEHGDEHFSVVVQVGRGDSVLMPMETAALKQWWEPIACEIVRGDKLADQLETSGGRAALWPWLIFLAGLLLVAEMYFVHRLCPRADPKLTHNLITPRAASGAAATRG